MKPERTPSVRGIYRAVTLSLEGFPILQAVTSDNRKIKEHVLMPFEDETEIADRLFELLDEVDPVRRVA